MVIPGTSAKNPPVALSWVGKSLPDFALPGSECLLREVWEPGLSLRTSPDTADCPQENRGAAQRNSCEDTFVQRTAGESKRETAARQRIYQGENLEVLRGLLAEYHGKIDCIYIDPPFLSGTDYAAKVRLRGGSGDDSRQGELLSLPQYTDRFEPAEYLQFMYERLWILRELLADAGSIYVHCDWHAAAALRLLMDEVFGARNLLNEIVWSYGSGGGSKRRFGRKHDTILLYAKQAGQHFFNADAVRVPYRATIAAKRSALFHPDGMVSPDVWDIPRPPNHANSWTGYPTQKPVEVVSRALAASCPADGLALDCFAGSGTTLVAAAALGLRAIGIERTNLGVASARRRLVEAGLGVEVYRPIPEGNAPAQRGGVSVKAAPDQSGFRISGLQVPELRAQLRAAGLESVRWSRLVDCLAIDPDYDGTVFRPGYVEFAGVNDSVSAYYYLGGARICIQVTDIAGGISWYDQGA